MFFGTMFADGSLETDLDKRVYTPQRGIVHVQQTSKDQNVVWNLAGRTTRLDKNTKCRPVAMVLIT